jgi:predicted metal-dependent phosphotriesterase family hydrolase
MMIELLENYPKAAVKIKEWFLEKMLDNLKKTDDTVPEEFKDYVRQQGIDDDKIAKIIGNNPRALFDVFDENEIFIDVTFDHEHRVFRYSFDGKVESNDYTLRKDAEAAAVTEAFKILNDKL